MSFQPNIPLGAVYCVHPGLLFALEYVCDVGGNLSVDLLATRYELFGFRGPYKSIDLKTSHSSEVNALGYESEKYNLSKDEKS